MKEKKILHESTMRVKIRVKLVKKENSSDQYTRGRDDGYGVMYLLFFLLFIKNNSYVV